MSTPKGQYLRLILAALVAGIAGAAASVYFDPTIATRLAGTGPGQQVLAVVLDAQAPATPAGLIVAKPGDIVPNMTLSDPDGTPVILPQAWAGKPTLVNLWATWCAPCLKEMPDLQAFADQQGTEGVQVVGIALDDAGAVRDFMRQHGISYATLVDAPGPTDASVRLGNPNGVLPYTVLVSADGRLVKRRIGPFPSAQYIARWAIEN